VGNASRYRPNRRIFVLTFEDEDYDGLVVKARSVKLGSFLQVANLLKLDPQNVQPEDVEKFAELFEQFADALVEWNLEDDDGQEVPATLEGVQRQDVDFIMPIIKAWFEGIAGIASPLGTSSSNGQPSAPPPLPMEPLPAPQAS
jgi:hypothetical protein